MNRLIAPHHVVSLCDEIPQTMIDLGESMQCNYKPDYHASDLSMSLASDKADPMAESWQSVHSDDVSSEHEPKQKYTSHEIDDFVLIDKEDE